MEQTQPNNQTQSNSGTVNQSITITNPKEEEYRAKLFEIITNILNSGMDLGLSLVDINCEKKNECPLYKYSIEMVRKLRELKEVSKQMRKQ